MATNSAIFWPICPPKVWPRGRGWIAAVMRWWKCTKADRRGRNPRSKRQSAGRHWRQKRIKRIIIIIIIFQNSHLVGAKALLDQFMGVAGEVLPASRPQNFNGQNRGRRKRPFPEHRRTAEMQGVGVEWDWMMLIILQHFSQCCCCYFVNVKFIWREKWATFERKK